MAPPGGDIKFVFHRSKSKFPTLSHAIFIQKKVAKFLSGAKKKRPIQFSTLLKSECYVYRFIEDTVPGGISPTFSGFCDFYNRRSNIISGGARPKMVQKLAKKVVEIRIGAKFVVQFVATDEENPTYLQIFKIKREIGQNPSLEELDTTIVNAVWTQRGYHRNFDFLFELIEPFLIIPDDGQFTIFALNNLSIPPTVVEHSRLHRFWDFLFFEKVFS